MITKDEIESTSRVIVNNLAMDLMNNLPGFVELLGGITRDRPFAWSARLHEMEKDVRDILEGRLSEVIED